MKFKNKQTGLLWLVSDVDLINRLNNDPDYEVVEDEQEEKKPRKKREAGGQ